MATEIQSEALKADVLVLGGGIAGCFAAIKAREGGADVLMVDKGNLGRSGLSHQMSGVLTYFDPEKDNYDQWYQECVEAGMWLSDQDCLEGMINETTDRVRDLESFGATFLKEKGELIRKAGVGQKYGRNAIMVNGGFELMSVLRGEVLRCGTRLLERTMITNLLTSDGKLPTGGKVIGAVGFNIRNGKFYVINAKSTVIATGPTLAILPRLPMYSLSGDGKAMAFRAGAQLRNVELASIAPRPRDFNTAPGVNILFGEGSFLLNAKGERFMEQWDKQRMERAPRVVVGRAISTEILEGRGPVYLDATHLDDAAHGRIEKAIPILMQSFAKGSLSLRKDKIPYSISTMDHGPGGIRIDRGGTATLPGLFAAGASSDHGEDGVTNIISHGMASACLGARAGKSSAEYAFKSSLLPMSEAQVTTLQDHAFAPMKRETGLTRREVRRRCVDIVERGLVGVIRTGKGLKQAIEEIVAIKEKDIPRLFATDYHDLAGVHGIENGLVFLETQARCALMRTESRGSHFREDYPKRDDVNWMKWVIVRKEDDKIRVWAEPIPIKGYRLQPKEGGS